MSLTKVTYSMIQGAVVNVLDFGADQSGTSDSTTAIQAAINAANVKGVSALNKGAVVFFPAGKYLISDTIVLTAGNLVSLAGEGKPSEIFWGGAGSTPMFKLDGSLSIGSENKIFVEKLAFNGDSVSNLIAFDLNSNGQFLVNLTFSQNYFVTCAYGIKADTEVDQVVISDNYFLDYDVAVYTLGGFCSNWKLRDNHFRGGRNDSWALYHSGGSNIAFENNTIQSATTGQRGLALNNVGSFRITNTYWECSGVAGVSDGPFLQLAGCRTGLIEENYTTGTVGPNIVTVDSACANLTFGQHRHGTSGDTPTYFLNIGAAATGINIIGTFDAQGVAIATYTGPVAYSLNNGLSGAAPLVPYLFPETLSTTSISQYKSFVTATASSATNLFDIDAQVGSWLVVAYNITENYWVYNFVHSNGTTVATHELFKTNANLTLAVSGTNVQAVNGIASNRTVRYAAFRLF